MKRPIVTFLFMAGFLFTSSMAADKKPAKDSASADTLAVTARLLEIPGKFAPNDLYNYVYIMKYRVIKVKKGADPGKEILVGQYNPLIPRDKIKDKMDELVGGDLEKFKPGDKHELILVSPLEDYWNEAVEDEYFDLEQTRYFALQTDLLKK